MNEKMLKEATIGVDLGSKAGDCSVEKGVFQPNKEKRKGVYFPDYWKKKKLNLSKEISKKRNQQRKN